MMRNQVFSFSGVTDKFKDLITKGQMFKFGMVDIPRIREEMKTLITLLTYHYTQLNQTETMPILPETIPTQPQIIPTLPESMPTLPPVIENGTTDVHLNNAIRLLRKYFLTGYTNKMTGMSLGQFLSLNLNQDLNFLSTYCEKFLSNVDMDQIYEQVDNDAIDGEKLRETTVTVTNVLAEMGLEFRLN